MYGPETTGSLFVKVVGLPTFDQTCCGTTRVCAICCANGTSGVLNRNVTTLPFALTERRCCQTPLPSSPGLRLRSPNVYVTSAAVSGVPSLHFAPLRIVKRSVVFPAKL